MSAICFASIVLKEDFKSSNGPRGASGESKSCDCARPPILLDSFEETIDPVDLEECFSKARRISISCSKILVL